MCDFLLVINSNLHHILHLFRDRGFEGSKSLYMATLLAFNPTFPMNGFQWDDLRKILPGCQRMANVPNAVETLTKISIA